MNRIIYLLLLLCCIRVNAQVITITYSGDKIKECKVEGSNLTSVTSINDTLDYRGQVTNVSIKEEPNLGAAQEHSIIVGDLVQTYQGGSTTINCHTSNSKDLNSPITLKGGEKIMCKRGNDVIGVIVVKEKNLSPQDILKTIVSEPIYPKKSAYTFEKDSTTSFSCLLKGIDKIKTENISVICNEKKISYQFDKEKLSFNINPLELQKDSTYDVYLIFDVSGHQELANSKILLFSVTSHFEHGGRSIYEIAIAVVVFLIIALVFLHFYIKRKFKGAKCYKDTYTQKKYKILCNDEPQIGNLSNRPGECRTADGYIYRFKRRKKWSLFPELFFIGRKIECKNDTAFIYNMENANDVSPCIKIDLNGTPFSICKGASVEGKGTYEIEDYVIQIEAQNIYSISKSIKDIKTIKIYRVVLTNDTPQKNDEVIPPIQINSKKFYQFESREGVIYEVRNNRIDNIRMSSPQQSQNVLTLISIDNKKITVITQGEKPSINDIASPDGNYQLNDGTILIVKDSRVISVENKITEPDVDPTDLLKELQSARKQIESLSKRPTSEQYTEIVNKLSEANEKLKDTDKAIADAVIKARADEKHKVESIYKKKINEEYILISTYKREKTNLEKQKEEAIKAMNKAEEKAKTKEGEIKSAKERIVKLDEEKKISS